jgi:hypothetical protein
MRTADDPEGFPLNDVTNRSTLVPKPTLKNVSEKKAESLSPGKNLVIFYRSMVFNLSWFQPAFK